MNLFLGKQECRHCIRFRWRKKKWLPNEFWKKKNGDRSKINSPILRQRYGLKFSHHPYLTHLNITCTPKTSMSLFPTLLDRSSVIHLGQFISFNKGLLLILYIMRNFCCLKHKKNICFGSFTQRCKSIV